MTVIHEDTPDQFTVVDTVKTQKLSKMMALDPKTHRLFVPCGEIRLQPPASPGGEQIKTVVPGTFSILVLGR